MITIRAIPTKVRAHDLREGDVIVKSGDVLDRLVNVVHESGSTVYVEFYRYRISDDADDFAVHEDPPALERIRYSAWVRIIRTEVS